MQLSDDTVEHASSASDLSISNAFSIRIHHVRGGVLTNGARVGMQVPDAIQVEQDEHGRGCVVDTDIGRVKLGDLCTSRSDRRFT